jgi:hypothetical protein
LQTILGDPEALGKLNPATKTAMQMVLPGVRQAANIGTATARSTLRLGEQREKGLLREARDRTQGELVRIKRLEQSLKTAGDRFVDSTSSRSTQPALRRAHENFLRIGGSTAVGQAIVDDANIRRRLKFEEPRLKRQTERAEQKTKRRQEIRLARKTAGPEARRVRLGGLGLAESTKVPGGGTLGEALGTRQQFREAVGKVQGRRKLFKGGLLGGAAAVGIPLLLKLMGGGKKKPGDELPPEIQMQLMQAMTQGGGQGVDPALGTGRNLRNVFQLLQIIKTLRDMQGMQQQPSGGLV